MDANTPPSAWLCKVAMSASCNKQCPIIHVHRKYSMAVIIIVNGKDKDQAPKPLRSFVTPLAFKAQFNAHVTWRA